MYIIIFWLYIFSCIIFNILLHMPIHVYVYTHTHTHTYTHMHTHAVTHSHTHARTHACTNAHAHTHRQRFHFGTGTSSRHMSKFTADVSKHFSRRVQPSRRRVQNFSPTRPNFPPTRPRFPTDATIYFWTPRLAELVTLLTRPGTNELIGSQWSLSIAIKAVLYPQGMCFKKILLCKHSGKGTMKPRFPPMQGEELPTSWYR